MTQPLIRLAVAVAACMSASAHAAALTAVMDHLPRYPTPDRPIALHIGDSMSSSGILVEPHTVTISGNTIRVEGCVDNGGHFPGPGSYAVNVPVEPVLAGTYTVEYFRTFCGNFRPPLELAGTWTIEVRERSPDWPPPPGSVAEVFEYFHPAFRHYFISANEDEQLAIETGRFGGWERVTPMPGYPAVARYGFFISPESDGRIPICRFFGSSFGDKSSHFYTTSMAECEIVKKNPLWAYEGIVGYVWPPYGDGTCTRGAPLYRLYNNGASGAPNHRYLRDPTYFSSMLNRGWIPEGYGPGVIGCVPTGEEFGMAMK